MFKITKVILIFFMIFFSEKLANASYKKLAHEFKFESIDGEIINLSNYKNKIIIIINVASKCGFTKQYNDMQEIWDHYKNKDVILIGIPSNDFGGQEPGTNKEIKNFCESKFGITFLMTKKISVKGPLAHPFYIWAKNNHGNSAVPKWNFHKIIIGKDGKVFDTFASITRPTSIRFKKVIDKLIDK